MIRIHVRKISDEKSLITAVSGFESTVTAIIEGT